MEDCEWLGRREVKACHLKTESIVFLPNTHDDAGAQSLTSATRLLGKYHGVSLALITGYW